MRADRLLAIMILLQTRGRMTTQRLAEELEVSRRTILRDIEALSVAGVPVYAEGGHGGGVALDDNYRSTLTGLQDKEVRTLFIANNAQLLNEIGLGEAAKSTLLKLLAVLPTTHRPSVETMRQRILIDPLWWWRDTQPLPFWNRLQQAVYEDRLVRGIYEHRNHQIIERLLEPYSLVAKSSVWYLVARHDEGWRTYRVSRFQEIILLDGHFHRQADFDLPTYWHKHSQEFVATTPDYRFTLRLPVDRLNFIRWLAPGHYNIVEQSDTDGCITVHFHLESIDLAKMLVFGLGRDAVVVEPLDLKEAILNTAREILNSSEHERAWVLRG